MRITLVHNPGAGRQSRDNLRRLVSLLEEAGHVPRLQSAAEPDWEEALEWPTDVIAAAGGDGTLGKVATRLVGRATPLAPLPSGTANNISRSLGLIERPFEELVQAWPDARRVRIDVGIAKGPWGERCFVESLGCGLFADLLAEPKPERERIERMPADRQVAAALELLKREAERRGELELQLSVDGKDLSGRYLLAEVVAIPYVGPNLYLAPDSRPGDGCFDVVLVREAERARLANYLASWQDNRERLSVLPSHRGTRIRIQWKGFPVHIDDSLWPGEQESRPTEGSIDISIAGQVEVLAP